MVQQYFSCVEITCDEHMTMVYLKYALTICNFLDHFNTPCWYKIGINKGEFLCLKFVVALGLYKNFRQI